LNPSSEDVEWVATALAYRFLDQSLCRAALTHRSAGSKHNERLEFLGDSVLNCAAARLLYQTYPEADEGDLSRRRASLVSGEMLASIAADIGLGERLHLGSGELKSGGFRRASILADGLEALIGAIFCEAGFETAAAVVCQVLEPRMSRLPTAEALKDPKTRLQEALQAQGLALPVYTLIGVVGESHAQSFTVACEVRALALSSKGEGASRRRAEQQAADRLLTLLAEQAPNRLKA
jgi:ribonuclease III